MKKKRIILTVALGCVLLALTVVMIAIVRINADVDGSLRSANRSEVGNTSVDGSDESTIDRYIFETSEDGVLYRLDTFKNVFKPGVGSFAGEILVDGQYVWSDSALAISSSGEVFLEGEWGSWYTSFGKVDFETGQTYAFFYQVKQEDGSWGAYQRIKENVFRLYVQGYSEDVLVSDFYAFDGSVADSRAVILEAAAEDAPTWFRLSCFVAQKVG